MKKDSFRPALTNRRKNEQSHLNFKPNAAQGLRDLFVDELKDIYWAEAAQVRALRNMSENASSDLLVKLLTEHNKTTLLQIEKIEKVFEFINEAPEAIKCESMTGLIKESENIMIETERGMVRDAGIISAGQKIKHYEIATYGTLFSFAKTLGEFNSSAILQEILIEEKEADKALSILAESFINIEASAIHDNMFEAFDAQ